MQMFRSDCQRGMGPVKKNWDLTKFKGAEHDIAGMSAWENLPINYIVQHTSQEGKLNLFSSKNTLQVEIKELMY